MAVKNKTELTNQNNNDITSNSSGLITGPVLNDLLKNIIDSYRHVNRDYGKGITNSVGQDSVQTTDATETSILEINMPNDVVKTIQGQIVGYNNDKSNVIGINFFFVVGRGSSDSFVIETPQVSISSNNSNLDIEFVKDDSSQNTLIRVIGESETTYDWKIDYSINQI